MNRKHQHVSVQDYASSQLQSGVTNRDEDKREEDKAGMQKEQIQICGWASKAPARFPAVLRSA